MTIFVVVCVAMVAASLALVAWPLLKARNGTGNADDTKAAPRKSYLAAIIIAIVIPLTASFVYVKFGRMNWESELAQAAQAKNGPRRADLEAMATRLEKRLRESPDDTAAAMQLGETLVSLDERSFAGRAGQLFESVVAKEPNNPKALWYSAIVALTVNDLPLAHDRLERMLAQNPPAEIRQIIENQVRDIEQQLSAAGKPLPKSEAGTKSAASQSDRSLVVQVTIAPQLAKGLDKKTKLFVLARDPNTPGPPLAVAPRVADDLPLSVTLTDNDAMLPGHGISSVPRVQVVARLSKTGTPQAQPGDLFGDASVEFKDMKSVTVKIVIDRTVPPR